jgi:hypothetical protein
MKVTTETRTIPAEDVTVTTYGCEQCDFSSDTKHDVEKHYAKEHACRCTMEAGGIDWLRFETEQDAKAWLSEADDSFSSPGAVGWTGPGWYRSVGRSEPCGRGCCTRYYLDLVSVGEWTSERIGEARAIMARVSAVRRDMREAGYG